MNVTLKLSDALCKKARHRAVDESKSLSAWVTGLLERELERPSAASEKSKSLIEAATLSDAPDWFYDKDFALEDRRQGKVRHFTFEN
jgi:hypothetical protein